MSQFYLRLFKQGDFSEQKQFANEKVVIGRGAKVDLDLQEDSVSPIHAMIEKRQGKFYICDLGSERGTYKNGQKILDEPLVPGDRLKVGSVEMEFQEGAPKIFAIPTPLGEAPTGTPLQPRVAEGRKTAKIPDTPPVSLSRGQVLEINIEWNGKILESHHFTEAQVVYYGGTDKSQISVAGAGAPKKLAEIHRQVTVFLRPNAEAQLVTESLSYSQDELVQNGRLSQVGALTLQQGEELRYQINDDIVLVFRYVRKSPVPILAPLFDLTMSELTGLVMSLLVALVLAFYVSVYESPEELQKPEEVQRLAEFVYKPPPQKVKKVRPTPTPRRRRRRIERIDLSQRPPMTRRSRIRRKPMVRSAKPPTGVRPPSMTRNSGVAMNLRRRKIYRQARKRYSSVRQGKAVKVAKKPGASAATKQKDVSRLGVLGVLSSSGTRDRLDKASSGKGFITGLSDAQDAGIGQAQDRDGFGVGYEIPDSGVSGTGVSSVGAGDIQTKGRGSGVSGYGTGGLGAKLDFDIKLGGDEEEFYGTIDREAVRRVIQRNLSQVRSCYEFALRRESKQLSGKLVLEWLIAEEGQVLEPKVISNSIGSDTVGQCVIRVLRTWRFPEPPAGVVGKIQFPFNMVRSQ